MFGCFVWVVELNNAKSQKEDNAPNTEYEDLLIVQLDNYTGIFSSITVFPY